MASKPKHRADSPGVVVWEEYVGQAPDAICYPGVSSCLTITCVSPGGLSGTHLTIGSPPEFIAEAIDMLAAPGTAFTHIFVAGKIDLFKTSTKDKGFNTRKKMSTRLSKALGFRRSSILFYDTAPLATGVHLGVVRGPGGAAFSWQDEKAAMVRGFAMPDFGAWTAIPASAFIAR